MIIFFMIMFWFFPQGRSNLGSPKMYNLVKTRGQGPIRKATGSFCFTLKKFTPSHWKMVDLPMSLGPFAPFPSGLPPVLNSKYKPSPTLGQIKNALWIKSSMTSWIISFQRYTEISSFVAQNICIVVSNFPLKSWSLHISRKAHTCFCDIISWLCGQLDM